MEHQIYSESVYSGGLFYEHKHGTAKSSCFFHLAVEVQAAGVPNEWLEPVNDNQYIVL